MRWTRTLPSGHQPIVPVESCRRCPAHRPPLRFVTALSDLGLARVFTAGAALTGMAPETSVEYLDPSLLLGDPPSRSTDIWALGATLHRALSGKGLYGELPERQPLLAIRRVQTSQPTIDPSLTPGEAALVLACLAAPDKRPTTAVEVADRIADLRVAG